MQFCLRTGPRAVPVRMDRPARVGLLVVIAVASLGCVTAGAISRRAINYNVAAETARNEMLLLNILRARSQYPMIFTGLSRITGSLRTEARIGGNTNLQSGDPIQQAISPSVGLIDSPTFDVAVLESQEFMRGIMTPLSFDLIEYLWDQGFTREVLLYLTVERIEVACARADSLRELVNEPGDPSFEAFQNALNALVESGTWEMDQNQAEAIGPAVDGTEAQRLAALIQVAGSRLTLKPLEGGTWQLERQTTNRRLVARGYEPCNGDRLRRGARATAGPVRFYDTKVAFERAIDTAPDETGGRIVLRSPQSVLFYLGELTRPGGQVVIRRGEATRTPEQRRLFVISEAAECGPGAIGATYGGTAYVIPTGEGACDPGRSLQSLSLAAQLLALQQSARDLPIGGTVRIVGQ